MSEEKRSRGAWFVLKVPLAITEIRTYTTNRDGHGE